MQRSIQLLSGTGEIITGLLCSMSDRHLEDFETVWKGILKATERPDGYWSWADGETIQGEKLVG